MSACAQWVSGMTGESFEPNREWTRVRQAYGAAGYEWTRKIHHRDTENTEEMIHRLRRLHRFLLRVEHCL
jgi:hypothetical protein